MAESDDLGQTGPAEVRGGTRKRNLIIAVSVVAVGALFGLMGWALAQSGGQPGGLGINNDFGEIDIQQRAAPQFAVEGLDGDTVDLTALRGKVVMLDFWSSWCPPCRREAPSLAQVYREYRDRNVEFVGVAIWDSPGEVRRYVEDFELDFPNVVDDRGRIGIDYGVAGIPEKFFIDSKGNVVRKFVGPMEPDVLRDALDSLLAPQTPDQAGG